MKQGKKETQAAAAEVQDEDEATEIGQDEEDEQPFNEIDQL